MANPAKAWHDPDRRGKALNSIAQQCATKFKNELEKGHYELAISFANTSLKAEATLWPYVDAYNGITKFLKDKRKVENRIGSHVQVQS